MGTWYNIKSAAIGWFGNILVYKYPLFIQLGHTAYKINGKHQREILDCLEPGDVLLRRYDNYLSGLILPGYFTHAAIYIGDNKIIHMLGDGIVKEDILTFMRCDDIAVLRTKVETGRAPAVSKAEEYLKDKIQYDFDFKFSDDKRFSCTELIHNCYDYFPIKDPMRKNMVLPDDFLHSPYFQHIWRK